MNEWIAAAIAVAVALVVGSMVRALVVRSLENERRPEALRKGAPAIGGLVFSLFAIGGLLVALGFVDPDSLEELPQNVVNFIPKALAAAILLIGGNIAASFAVVGLGRALAGLPAGTQRRVQSAVKIAILAAAGLLAAGQLGVNTTILTLAAAALFFSIGASFTLLSGLGGRRVSAELAAGRSNRRMVDVGDHLEVAGQSGTVTALHPAAIELSTDDGSVVLLPHSVLLDHPTRLRRVKRA